MKRISQKDLPLIINSPINKFFPYDAEIFSAAHFEGRVVISYYSSVKLVSTITKRKFIITVSDNLLEDFLEYTHLGSFGVDCFLYHVFEITGINKE